MKGPSPATDALMWQLAEGQDADSIEQFCTRYPELRQEVLHRANMVHRLRESKPGGTAKPFAPQLLEVRSRRPIWRTAVPAFLLAGVAFAGLALGKYLGSQSPAPVAPAPSQVRETTTSRFGDEAPLRADTRRTETSPNPSVSNDPTRSQSPDNQAPDHRDTDAKPWDAPITVKLRGVSLLDAFKLIAASGHCQIEVAPGFEDQIVEADYFGRSPGAILKALAQSLNFTVFDQEPGHFLVVPASPSTQPSRQPDELPTIYR
ncbi:MAG: hypothetical protein JST40_11095 [Armatimonadetes bacterium]|nr:hypothetical protein [Armatimonadota bacterium]